MIPRPSAAPESLHRDAHPPGWPRRDRRGRHGRPRGRRHPAPGRARGRGARATRLRRRPGPLHRLQGARLRRGAPLLLPRRQRRGQRPHPLEHAARRVAAHRLQDQRAHRGQGCALAAVLLGGVQAAAAGHLPVRQAQHAEARPAHARVGGLPAGRVRHGHVPRVPRPLPAQEGARVRGRHQAAPRLVPAGGAHDPQRARRQARQDAPARAGGHREVPGALPRRAQAGRGGAGRRRGERGRRERGGRAAARAWATSWR